MVMQIGRITFRHGSGPSSFSGSPRRCPGACHCWRAGDTRSPSSKEAKALAKGANDSGKTMVEGGTSAVGGDVAPKTPIELPKIVYLVLTPSSSSLVSGA